MLQDLLELISQYSFVDGLDDQLLWKFDTSGNFSVKSFSLQVVRDAASTLVVNSQVRMVWKKLAPPRVEILVWLIMLGRLSTKDRLVKLNCISILDQNCVLYGADIESVSHLFFSCPLAWLLWHRCMQWWGIYWCLPNEPIVFFKAWEGAPYRGFERKLWISLLYVVLWTIWRIRNRVIFEQYTPNWELEVQLIKTRLGYWTRGWCQDLPFTAGQFATDFDHIRKWRVKNNIRRLAI